MNEAGAARALCPFYVTETTTSVTCDGLLGLTVNHRFLNGADKRQTTARYCCDKWQECPMTRAIMAEKFTEEKTT